LSSLLLFLSTVSCFTTVPSTSHRTHPMRPLYALSPEHLHELASNIHQHSHFFSSNLLADAAEAAVVDDGGWWQTYLNIFKVTLKAVHDTIDAPLRSIGFDQTWGVSIALFTASESGLCHLTLQLLARWVGFLTISFTSLLPHSGPWCISTPFDPTNQIGGIYESSKAIRC
jgi:hypothetical protein